MSDVSASEFQASAARTTNSKPKLRRAKASISGSLQETTAVQRLVEYFVIVSCRPRWRHGTANSDSNRKVNSQPTSPRLYKSKFSKKLERFKGSYNSAKVSSHTQRQESPPDVLTGPAQNASADTDACTSSGPAASSGNITFPQHLAEEEYTFQPVITGRYPPTDYDDNPLNPMILQFCFPASDVVVPSLTYELPRVHHFVLTTGRGRKVYGTCLTVMEEYQAPESPEDDKQSTKILSTSDGEDGIELAFGNKRESVAMYIPKVMCILSAWPYLTAIREYLSQLYRLTTASNVMRVPLERYVCNICKEIPAPPPGAYEIQLDILDSTIRFWAPPAKLPIAYVALPYNTLFECLDLDHIIYLWRALLVERKILLLSSQHSSLTICAEILCSLLFPFRWSHLYAPLLPRMLCPILDAPVPFLCGLVRENWLHAQQYLPPDCIVVDLDRNRIQVGDIFPMPDPPSRKYSKLKASLRNAVGHVFWQARGAEAEYRELLNKKPSMRSFDQLRNSVKDARCWQERMAGQDLAFTLAYTPDSPNISLKTGTLTEPSQWDQVQEAFLRFLVALFKGYRKHLFLPAEGKEDDDFSKPSMRCSDSSLTRFRLGCEARFDTIGFIGRAKAENVPFLNELCTTQQFDDFITRRMYSPGEPDLQFFDQSIDAKLNRSKLKIRKVDTPLLNSAKVHKDLKKLKALPPNQRGLLLEGNIRGLECSRKPYVYNTLPETFDENLFSQPRPIPKMISAEFDRQSILASKLLSNLLVDNEDSEYLLEDISLNLFGADYDPSPEVASFTTFLFVYCSIVGLEWQKYVNDRRVELLKKRPVHLSERVANHVDVKREDLDASASEIMIENLNRHSAPLDCMVNDLSFGLVDCPGKATFSFGSQFFTVETDVEVASESIAAKRFSQSTQQHRVTPTDDQGEKLLPEMDEDIVEFEEAREVAWAQLDLSFETLATMTVRGLRVDSDAYLSLMEACARCGNTKRAVQLMELMKQDNFVVDGTILSSFMNSFAQDDVSLHIRRLDAYTRLKTFAHDEEKLSDEILRQTIHGGFPQLTNDKDGLISSATSFDDSVLSNWSSSTGGSSVLPNWFATNTSAKKKDNRSRRRHKSPTSDMSATPMFSQQLELSENLIDLVYQDLTIDTSSDSCPHCSYALSENDIVTGWTPCAFQNYTTHCPKCQHRFVPRFVVACSSPDFQGSQGYQTPLFCEFLSPWVLRKEFQQIIKHGDGIERIIDPEWRSGTDIRATLFWNLMVLCRRYKLPFCFLLQGNFQNRLILPRRPDAV